MGEILKEMVGQRVAIGSFSIGADTGLTGELLNWVANRVEPNCWVLIHIHTGTVDHCFKRPTWICLGPGMGIALLQSDGER